MNRRITNFILSSLLILNLLPLVPTPAAAATTAPMPFVEDFESITDATIAADYTLKETTGSTVRVVDDPVTPGNKVVYLYDPGAGQAGIGRDFTSTSGIATFEFDYMQPDVGGGAKVFDLYSGSTVALEIQAQTAGNFTYTGPGTVFGQGLLAANTWVRFRIVVDMNAGAARQVTIYVGKRGETLQEVTGITTFKSAVTNVNKFDSTTPGGSAKSQYLDNINFYAGTTPPGPALPTAAPAGLAAVAGDNQVSLTWNAVAGSTGTVYTVKRGTQAGGPYTQVGTGSTTSFIDSTAVNGTAYYYVVTAKGLGQSESAASNEVAASPVAPAIPPNAPSGVTATAGNGQVLLSWTAVSNAASYKIMRGTDGQSFAQFGGSLTAANYTDSAVTNGTKYYYKVVAVNPYGETSSTIVNATPVSNPLPPAAPAGLTATAGNGQVVLSWTPVSEATSYTVKRSTNGQTYANVATGLTATSYTNSGLTNDTKYYYVVSAVNLNGESGNSAAANATPLAPPALDSYNLAGFSYGNTGGGNIPETDAKYIKVYNATDFAKAVNRKNGYKVVEIMNDLNLGWNELSAEAKTTAGALFVANATPQTHPVLMQTGVSKIYLDTLSNITIFSANGSKIKHAGFTIKHGSNIIIRNLEFDELWEWDELTKGDYDKNDWDYMTLEDESKVWIDHCTFNKSYDGGIDVKQGSSGVTISWSLFKGDDRGPNSWVTQQIHALEANKASYAMYKFLRDQGLSVEDIIAVAAGQKKQHLVGATEFDSKNPNLQVTLHHNYYKDMQDRMPRLRGGNVHAYNIVMDSANNWAAKKRINSTQEAAISAKGYHFGVTSNGAISTEGGAVLVENSEIVDVFYPMRNNQVDAAKSQYTGKILAKDTIYSLDGVTFRGNSDTLNSPMTPVPATPLEFSWSGMTDLPYTYTLDDPSTVKSRLTAEDGAGAGKLAWPKANWLLASGYSSDGSAPTAPTTVGGVSATGTNNGQVALKWNAVSGATSYNIKRSTVNGGSYQTLTTVPGLSYTDTSVSVGTAYYYVISAVNSVGEGSDSVQVSCTPAIVTVVAPSAPTSVNAAAGDAQVTITWGSTSGATSYKVKRSTTDGQNYSEIANNITTTNYKDTNVTNGTVYYYVVNAVNEAGDSVNSSQASAKPVAGQDVTTGMSLLVNDNFDAQTTGAKPDGYEVSELGGAVQIANVPSSSNKSIFINDTNASSFSQISKSFPEQTKKVIVQADFMQQTKANSAKVIRVQPAQGGTLPAVSIETVSGNLTYRVAGATDTYTVLSGYNANTWYTIQIVADIETQKADVYINGVAKIQQAPFYAANNSLSLLESYTSNGGTVGHYIDNVKIYGALDHLGLAASLSEVQPVGLGQSFSTNYGLSGVSSNASAAIYAQDVTIQFDAAAVEYVSAQSLKTGLSIVQVKTDIPGQIRMIVASQGPSGAVTTDGPLIKLNWKAKSTGQSATTTISVSQAKLSNSQGDITQANAASVKIQFVGLNKSALQSAVTGAQAAYDTTVEGNRMGQYPTGSKATLKAAIDAANALLANSEANQQQLDSGASVLSQVLQQFKALAQKPNIGDLGIVAAAYGLKSNSPNWNEIKIYDVNNDGEISITDLVDVARQMP
ncbi:fibronectin type III domain-containing protein [Paenibacillus radicis (ex Xue et al. 2023)]|uniref:Probable pectate lyase C n=1 Tax=Paenibacillus radicis (ex Xue et al. 2023) TaxID=2972489 RepID=A0ABT1YRP6_9BACL|nr:fibronectin type III domain-containing protein [Paenibacillus radicis (ex Xue et al. 2023)]MCR8635712.1 fibronectin type III domain-containing protein [Paenibacillus radicis (ex Xue et al. 2023)]